MSETREWMPIETAPRDGVAVLLCVAGYQPAVGSWTERGWEYQSKCDFAEPAHWDAWLAAASRWEPTHWMPLPQPPQVPHD